MKKRVLRNYPLHAAGHIWLVREVTLAELPDGSRAISQQALLRAHRAIANAICAGMDALSFEELDFLCDVTDTTYTKVAEHLDLHKSTITTWRKRGSLPSRVISNALRRWFWFALFGSELRAERLALSNFRDDQAFLETATQRAIRSHVTVSAELNEAS
jgi:hypothetical protein